MDSEKIKLLSAEIDAPLSVAQSLLEKHNGSVEACIRDYYNSNIAEIPPATGSDFVSAKENHEINLFDKANSTQNSNAKPLIISTREKPPQKNAIGFILWPEDEDGAAYTTEKCNDAFIPTADFDYVIQAFKSVFPLKNAWNDGVELSFDVTGNNYFDKDTCKRIIDKIRQVETNDIKVQNFKNELIAWLNDKLSYADYIVVYGNL